MEQQNQLKIKKQHSLNWLLKLIVVVTFLLMLAVNALSTLLPLNGVTPQEVSARYPNLFVPAGFTFSIWGAIYLALILYVLYLLGLFRGKAPVNEPLLVKTAVVFSVSSLVNTGWIFAFHYGALALSALMTAFLLICLIDIRHIIAAQPLSPREKLFVELPFSLYFGWVTVAVIANITALLVGLGWNGFGLSEPVWAIAILVIGAIIGLLTTLRFRDPAYALVLVWAYGGILANHLSPAGHNGAYPQVAFVTAACMALFLMGITLSLLRKKRTQKS